MVKFYNFNFQIIYYKINEYNKIKKSKIDKVPSELLGDWVIKVMKSDEE